MAYSDGIQTALGKGPQIARADLRDIQAELALMPLDEAHEAAAWVAEALWLIVANPDYMGDLTTDDLDL